MHSLRFCCLINEFVNFSPRISVIIPRNKSIRTMLSVQFPFSACGRNLMLRHIHSTNVYRFDSRKWVVTHLADEEFAMSALRRLELEVNKFKRAKKSDIEVVLKGNLKGLFVKDEDSIFIIRCCGALLPNEKLQTRINLTKAVWEKLCGSGIQLTSDHFTALLNTQIENCQHVCPREFLSEMKRLGVEPDRQTLIALLSCSDHRKASTYNMDALVIVVQELKSRGFAANTEMFEALASTLAESGDLIGAEDTVETMIKVQLEPTTAVYTSLIKGYMTLGDKASVLKILDQMEKRELNMTGSQYASVATKLAEMSSLSKTNGSQQVIDISNILPLLRVPVGEDTLQCVSNAVLELIYSEKESAALLLVLSLPPSLLIGHRFLEPLPILICKEIVRADSPPEIVVEICDKLEKLAVSLLSEEVGLEPFLLHTVTGLSLNLGKNTLSLFLLEALSIRGTVLRPHYCWPIMCIIAKKEHETKKEEGILKMLNKMVSLGVKPDFETLAHYTLPFMNPSNSALNAITILRKNGVTGAISRTAVTHWLLAKGDLPQAANLNEVHHGKIDPALLIEPLTMCLIKDITKPDKSILKYAARLLKSMSIKGTRGLDYTGLCLLEVSEKLGLFVNNGQVPELNTAIEYILTILKVVDANNLSISSQAADYLLYALQPQLELNGVGETASLNMPRVDSELILPVSENFQPVIPHPRDMNLEELESHLLELRAKGLNERGVLRRLFQLHCRLGNVERAVQITKDMHSGGHSFSPGMLSSLLDLYIQQSMLEKSEEVYQKIKSNHPDFKLDDHKVIDLATLLCRHGQINDAVILLRNHSKTVKVRPGRSIERNLLNLLQAVHASENKDIIVQNEMNKGMENGAMENNSWTTKKILDDLVKLGYVTNPPPNSILSRLKETDCLST